MGSYTSRKAKADDEYQKAYKSHKDYLVKCYSMEPIRKNLEGQEIVQQIMAINKDTLYY
jgi:hypothetical protein